MDGLVSVIVPVYNVAPYLRETADSLLHQTWRQLEILLIDDGSTDGSGEICDEYARRYPSLFRVIHQENRGLSAARNTGLDQMRGSLVAFLDADDVFHPDMIERTLRALRRSGADIVVCGFREYRAGRAAAPRLSSRESLLTAHEALRLLADKTINQEVWNKLYAAKLWDGLRFPQGRVYEDLSTTHRVLYRAEKVLTIPDVLVMRRTRPGSITQTESLQNVRDWLAAMDRYTAFVKEHVPDIYDARLLRQVQSRRLHGLIIHWLRFPVSRREEAAAVRSMILEAGSKIPPAQLSPKVRLDFGAVRSCPALYALLRPVYRLFRSPIRRATVK